MANKGTVTVTMEVAVQSKVEAALWANFAFAWFITTPNVGIIGAEYDSNGVLDNPKDDTWWTEQNLPTKKTVKWRKPFFPRLWNWRRPLH